MKAFVLMRRESGDLVEGLRMSFYDTLDGFDKCFPQKDNYQVAIVHHVGWVIYHPEHLRVWVFQTVEQIESTFEVLGEL